MYPRPPEFDQAYLNLARVYVIEGAKEKARAVLDELLKVNPAQVEGLELMEKLSN